MTDQRDSSSDLNFARSIAARLCGVPGHERAPGPTGYAVFRPVVGGQQLPHQVQQGQDSRIVHGSVPQSNPDASVPGNKAQTNETPLAVSPSVPAPATPMAPATQPLAPPAGLETTAAQRLATALAAAKAAPPTRRTTGSGMTKTFAPPASAAPTLPAAPPPFVLPTRGDDLGGGYGEMDWNAFVDWCLSATDGLEAFILDEAGLLVVVRGDLKLNDVQATGSRLLIAIEQAESMPEINRQPGLVSLATERGWFSGIRLKDGLVLGVIAPQPVTTTLYQAMLDIFRKHF